jgi:hypothetical protein
MGERVEGGYAMPALRPAFDAIMFVDRIKAATHSSKK